MSKSKSKGPKSKGPESKGPKSKGPKSKGPKSKGTKSKGTNSKGTKSKGTNSKGTNSKGTNSKGAKYRGPWDRNRWLIGKLRELTLIYPGRSECYKNAPRKIVMGDKGRKITLYQCNACGAYFKRDELEVDHIDEVGPFKGDWNEYLERMFCPSSNLQLLCISCHSRKTNQFVKSLRNREIWRDL